MRVIYGVVVKDGKKTRQALVLEDRECPICHSIFTPKRQDSNVCSRKCSKKDDYQKHSERYKNTSSQYYREHSDEINKTRSEQYLANPEYYKQRNREYIRKSKEKRHIKDAIYKDTLRHGGKRSELIENNGLKCELCGKEGTRFDIVAHHITLDNKEHEKQCLLCRSCHMRLHALIRHDRRRKNI